jgi:hypothetical protein
MLDNILFFVMIRAKVPITVQGHVSTIIKMVRASPAAAQ